MNKLLGFTRTFFSVLALFFAAASIAHASDSLNFVANDYELNVALKSAAQGTIGSVAIAEGFYQGSAKRTKDRIRGLIARTFELGNRAVYMYGPSLDISLAEELLDVRTPAVCTAPIFLGKLPDEKRPTEPVVLCGMMGDTSEEGMRQRLRMNNMHELHHRLGLGH